MTEQDEKDVWKAVGKMLVTGVAALVLWPFALLMAFGRICSEVSWWSVKPLIELYKEQRGEGGK